MNQIPILIIALICSLFMAATSTAHVTETPHAHSANQEGIDTAELWLKMVDEEKYSASWKTAAKVFKDAVTPEQWVKTVSGVRSALGPVLERSLFHDRFTTTLPGMPDGEYIIIRFVTKFENKQSAVETVSLKKEGQTWKVAGYFIK
ncbi:MAG: DUF4019 domain-containing protein [Desulfobacterales bacterium]|nr:DUF4019 domain-containing protein [Desulfobacterales bacterium]